MRVASLLLLGLVGLAGSAALAQTDLRSSFPGRRVGGGTRGECSARVLVHLVPSSSVYSPGASGLIGLLEGPSAQPRPVEVAFRPMAATGVAQAGSKRELPGSSAGVTLMRVALPQATQWESSYQCESGPGDASDPLGMVSASSPPALSLLLPQAAAADQPVQADLTALRKLCGRSVSRQQLATDFGLADVITAEWPEQLPVRCQL